MHGTCLVADTLVATCPRCGHKARDDMELIDPGVPLQMRCARCAGEFQLLLVECEHCASEHLVHTCGDATTVAAIASALVCERCHRPCHAPESEDDDVAHTLLS